MPVPRPTIVARTLLAAALPAIAAGGAMAQEPLSLRGVAAGAVPVEVVEPAPAPPRRAAPRMVAPVRQPLRGAVAAPVARAVRPAVTGLPPPLDPPPPPRRRAPEDDPYASLGLRLGGVTVLPAIEQAIGYDTNPRRVARGAEGSVVHRTQGEVALRSDWSRHALNGSLRGSYSAYPGVEGANRPEGEGNLTLRLDVLSETQVELESRFRLETLRPGSPELGAPVRGRPLVATYGASAGVTQRFNRFALGLRGSVDRAQYEDARLADGALLDQGDRDVTQAALRLRGSYELTPGLIPFVEATVDARTHAREVDRAGFRRDSTGVSGRVGSTFELTRLLTGEVSGGLQARTYEDERLKDLRGPVGEAALVWSATPLTTVRLRGAAAIEETTIANASGAVATRATLEVQHDLRRNLSLTAAATVAEADYRGVRLREETRAASLRVDYKLTRSVALRASFTHERLTSTAPGADYTANVYLVGLRFQP
jgi:hypothetical protein